jgi:hypothetical protein
MMLKNYKKWLFLLTISFVFTQAKSQTYVTTFVEDFEIKNGGTNVTSFGFDVWEGSVKVNKEVGGSYNGSSRHATSDISKNNLQIHRLIYPLTAGATYQVSIAARFPDGKKYQPLNIKKADATVSSYS